MLSNLNKPMVGVVIGAILGFLDGTTAWMYPEVRPMIAGILIGSTLKGLVAGLAAGFFARKMRSLPLGILFVDDVVLVIFGGLLLFFSRWVVVYIIFLGRFGSTAILEQIDRICLLKGENDQADQQQHRDHDDDQLFAVR